MTADPFEVRVGTLALEDAAPIRVTFTFANTKVTRVEVIGDPARLRELDITVL